MAKKIKKSKRKGAPGWMVTLSDMNTLMMTFFIIMMGDVTTVSQEEFRLVLSSFRGSLGVFRGGSTIAKGRLVELGHDILTLPSTQRARSLAKALKRALEVFKPEIQTQKLRVREDERGLVITLSGDAYFDTGSARLRDEAKPLLHKISKIIKNVPNYVRIEGHTDNRSIPPAGVREGYETNWELSSTRSINILRYLTEEENVKAKQLSAVAFGEYRPIDDNNTPEGRAYNRRVEIVILRDRGLPEKKTSKVERPLPDEEWR